ncbi:MAG: right-handed parallel beta-helix repeat-containing protein [Candidatus Saccharimonadales bacterium]
MRVVSLSALGRRRNRYIAGLAAIIGLGVTAWVISGIFAKADTAVTASFQAETGSIANCAAQVTDATAAGGGSVQFGGTGCTPAVYGASLPISYNLASLGGTQRFVATNGNDSSGNGTSGAPYATLAKAISVAVNNDSIVIRGGTYRGQANISVPANKTLRIIAYPGETPVFNGAQVVTGGWNTEGSYRYISYARRAVTDGSGISFVSGQNLTGDGVGKYADQAWVGGTQLRQVSAKASLANGTFWVDQTNNRLYMTATNAGQPSVEVTQLNRFMYVNSPRTSIEGIRVTRYSNNGGDYGVFIFAPTADNTIMRDVEVSEYAYLGVLYDGSSNRNDGGLMDRVTMTGGNWMGLSLNGTDNFTIQNSKLTNMNQFNEFTHDPQSGAVKTARTWHTKIIANSISGNKSPGVWFDISNYHAIIANNTMINNDGAAVFYEISDDLLLANNYIYSSIASAQPVKLAGSSGLKLVNNTIIGGRDPVGIYTDERSKTGCSNPANPPCGSWGNLRDSYHPLLATMDWIPRLDLMVNNIIAYPAGNGYCSGRAPVCITQRNSDAYVPINNTIHKADASRGIPQTQINGNVYANGTDKIISINEPAGRYTTLTAFSAAMAGAPVGIGGFETLGRYGDSYVGADGTPTAALTALHSSAFAVPVNADLNVYIPAGTKHYGVTWK